VKRLILLSSFRPEAIACSPSSNTSTCLTLGQIKAVRALYTDWYSGNGTFLFSRFEPGGELAYATSYVSGPNIALGPEYWKNFIFS
jgi:feruloyl esterase